MIRGIIAGYYRSGTTIFQRMYKISKQTDIVLHEPTAHHIVDFMLQCGYSKYIDLHGWKCLEDYGLLPQLVLHEFVRRHTLVFDDFKSNRGIITDAEVLDSLFEPLQACPRPIVIKTTQLALFLDYVSRKYLCWVLWLDRDTERIIADHAPIDKLDALTKPSTVTPFFGGLVYDELTRLFNVNPNARTPLQKLVFNIEVIRKVVRKQAEKNRLIHIINFDDFVENPHKYLDKLPFRLTDEALKLIDPSKRNPIPNKLRELVNKARSKFEDIIREIRWNNGSD